jgi:hypothetical protein
MDLRNIIAVVKHLVVDLNKCASTYWPTRPASATARL